MTTSSSSSSNVSSSSSSNVSSSSSSNVSSSSSFSILNCDICQKEIQDSILRQKICQHGCHVHLDCLQNEQPTHCKEHAEEIQYQAGTCSGACGICLSDYGTKCCLCMKETCTECCICTKETLPFIGYIIAGLIWLFSVTGIVITMGKVFTPEKLDDIGFDTSVGAFSSFICISITIFASMFGFVLSIPPIWLIYEIGSDKIKSKMKTFDDNWLKNLKNFIRDYPIITYFTTFFLNIVIQFLGQIALSIYYQTELFEIPWFGFFSYTCGLVATVAIWITFDIVATILIILFIWLPYGAWLLISYTCIEPYQRAQRRQIVVHV